MIAIFAGCRPFHKYWQINPDPGSEYYSLDTTGVVLTLDSRLVSTGHLQAHCLGLICSQYIN